MATRGRQCATDCGAHGFATSLWLVVAALVGCTIPDPPNAIWVTIPPGASLEAMGDSLAAGGIVHSSRAFQQFAAMGRKHEGIRPGVYPFRPGTPMGRVLVLLRKGRPPVQRIVVRERSMLGEVARLIHQRMGIPAESVQAAAGDSSIRARVGARAESVEGYLFPTTYYIKVAASADDIVRQMVDTFEARWQPEWDRRLDTLKLSRDELVTLASIIEGEIIRGEDRPQISSVYHNRLARGMRLQADPTVVYALGRRRRLYQKDYTIQSIYNTYRIDGLPPGPINQPSTASIEAALYPPESDFLYFVARRDGRHVFSRSYREHLASIRRVRRRGGNASGGGQ